MTSNRGHARAGERQGPRAVAVDALVRIDGGAFSHMLLPTLLARSSLDARGRAFVTEHVNGTLRWRRRLDDLLERVVDRPLDELDPPVKAAVRLGTHQLYTGVAAHAAVSETVSAVPYRARGFANAVLRKVSALGPPWPEPEGASALGITTSHPDWMVDRLQRAFGEDTARKVLDAANVPPGVVVRIRGDALARDAVARELAATGARVDAGHIASMALVVRGGGNPSSWASVRDGRATVQDESSQAVVDVVAPQRGERILDVAAAPGGKSSALAERVGPTGLVVAADLRIGRVGRIAETIDRLSLAGTLVPLVADGRTPPLRGNLDAVLVDAPCTGLGVLRRRPDARWRVQPADVAPLAALQRELLAAAAPLVRRGGRLVYSVCTWTDEETIGVAAWAETHLPDFTPEPLTAPWHPHDAGGLLLPSDGCDGMFVLNLHRAP